MRKGQARCSVFRWIPVAVGLTLGLGGVVEASGAPFAYVSNLQSSTVSVIDTTTNTVVATVPVGRLPIGVAVHPSAPRAYVTNQGDHSVSVIDTRSHSVVATVPVGVAPTGVAVHPNGTRVYVANQFSRTISVIETIGNSVVATISALGSGDIGGVAVHPNGTKVYVASHDDSTVRVIETASNTVIATVPVGSHPVGLVVHPNGTRLYVVNEFGNSVSVVDTAGNTVIATVPVGASPFGVSVMPDGGRVYVTNLMDNSVSVIETVGNTVIATVPVGLFPHGLSVHPDRTRVYVANSDGDSVSVIDTSSNTVVATVPVGSSPSAFSQFVGGQTSPLVNISSRARVLTGNDVLIGGFIIQGATPKTVLLRARGPSMGGAPFNISGVLANPTMQLYSGSTVIARNNDWQTTDPLCGTPATACGTAAQIMATAMDPCQPNPDQTVAPPGCAQESALLATLPPGGYTAIVSGVSGGTGVGLVEVFEADTIATARLINISSRARVETGNNVLIGGLIIGGTTPKTVLLRARGPSMGGAPFNIPGVLANPMIQLYSGSTVIAQNDNWQTTDPLCLSPAMACGDATEVSATAMDPCRPNPGQIVAPPGCSQESALLVTVLPGGYTMIVSGVGGTGVGLVEVFDATPPTVAISDVAVAEGNAGTTAANFTVTLSNTSTSPVTVPYATADGTATAPSDYVSTSGTLTIPAGSASGTISVAVNGDTLYEAGETFTVTLSAPTNATIEVGQGTGTGTITNDDSAPTLAINNVSLPEGNAGTTNFVFTVTQSTVSGLPTTVNYATADGTATAPSDYVSTSGTLAIPAGGTSGTISVAVNGDTLYEANETFTVMLSGPMIPTSTTTIGTGRILNDDSATDLAVTKTGSPDPATVGGNLTYTVTATNHGPDGATGVTVTDTLPAEVTFGTATWAGASTGTCSQAAGTVTCIIGNLANAASVTITIGVTPTAAGTLTNTADVSGNQTDPVTGNNSASITTTVNPPSGAPRLVNISSRARVLTDNDVLIGGFIISGTMPKTVLLRARGPSMGGAPFNISGVLANPTMQLYSGSTVIAQNNDWQTTDPLCGSPATACGGAAQISATVMDPCQPNPDQTVAPPGCSQESALLVTLPPGGYTAIVSGVSGGTGVGLVEVFEADTITTARMINMSSRARVETGDNVLIGGFIIQGTTPKTVLLRARGPSMGGAPFNIPGVLANPTMQLYAGATVIAQNNDWQTTDPLCGSPATACGDAAQITATAMDPCQPNPGQTGSPPGCSQEAALLVTLAPGGYTAIISGVGGGVGVGLVEVFEVP